MVEIKKNYFFFFIIALVIIAGIIIRTKLLLINDSFWYDTCALGANLTKNYIDLFKPLDYLQTAPPLFMFFSKFLYSIFSNSENLEKTDFVLRLIPFISSVLAIPLFSFIVFKLFNNYYITFFCTVLFSFNKYLIYYAREFKPYSLDVFCSLLLLFIFFKIDLKNISTKKLFLFSLLTALIPWLSYASLITIFSGYLILTFIGIKEKLFNIKKVLVLYIPVIISFLIFYYYHYMPVYNSLHERMLYHWQNIEPSFFTLNNFISMFIDKLNNMLDFNLGILYFVLCLFNIIIMLCLKNYKTASFILLPIIISILASFFNIYPFEKRLVLFLIPLLYILYSQFLILLPNNKKIFLFISILALMYSYKMINKPYSYWIYIKSNVREMYYILKQNNPNLINVISINELYEYYSKEKCIFSDIYSFNDDLSKSKIPEYIQTAPKGTYWIFLTDSKPKYAQLLKEYLYNNYKVEVIHYNPEYPNTFLMKIKND